MDSWVEPLGGKIRRQRRRMGLTLDELSGRSGISKPYLSLIETGRVPNPPSDEKLRRLEQTLGFTPGELLTQAHLQRTPRDVRAVLGNLLSRNKAAEGREAARAESARVELAKGEAAKGEITKGDSARGEAGKGEAGKKGKDAGPPSPASTASPSHPPAPAATASAASPTSAGGPAGHFPPAFDLDDAYLSGVLQELVDRSAGNVERVLTNAVPVINRVSAGYPRDFTDLSYPARVADEYAACPDVHDKDAFGARVHGDSMVPKYREGDIVIFSPASAPRDGDDCFVRFDDGRTTFKRVFFESDDAGSAVLRLQPRNEKYRPQVIPSTQVSGLWKAVFKYQRVDQD